MRWLSRSLRRPTSTPPRYDSLFMVTTHLRSAITRDVPSCNCWRSHFPPRETRVRNHSWPDVFTNYRFSLEGETRRRCRRVLVNLGSQETGWEDIMVVRMYSVNDTNYWISLQFRVLCRMKCVRSYFVSRRTTDYTTRSTLLWNRTVTILSPNLVPI